MQQFRHTRTLLEYVISFHHQTNVLFILILLYIIITNPLFSKWFACSYSFHHDSARCTRIFYHQKWQKILAIFFQTSKCNEFPVIFISVFVRLQNICSKVIVLKEENIIVNFDYEFPMPFSRISILYEFVEHPTKTLRIKT